MDCHFRDLLIRFPEFRGTINDKLMANPENDSPKEIAHKIISSQPQFDDLGVIIMRKSCSIQQDENDKCWIRAKSKKKSTVPFLCFFF